MKKLHINSTVSIEISAKDNRDNDCSFPDVDVDPCLTFDIHITGTHLNENKTISYYKGTGFVGEYAFIDLIKNNFEAEIAAFHDRP